VSGCKIIDLCLGGPHLSSFDGGRGAPLGYMFQMKEKKRESLTFCSFPSGILFSDDETTTPN
jgi:hypothetical protein